jgi:hypothetical protein
MTARPPQRTIARTRARLRLRGLARGGAIGLHAGLWVGAALVAAGKVAALPSLAAVGVGGLAAAALTGLGAALGAFRPLPEDRGLALLVDRLAGTDELVVTALHVADGPDPNRDAILARLAATELPPIGSLLPIRVPRHLRWAFAPLVLAGVALWLVPRVHLPWSAAPEPVVEEGRRLEQRLQQLASNPDGPDPLPIERDVAKLADQLQADELSPEEARQRLDELQKRLDSFDDQLKPSADLLKDLEQAARQLDQEATKPLGDALRDGDFDQAAQAANDLAKSLSEASPEERQRAAQALDQAGKRLAQSGDPGVQQLGQGLQQAADRMTGGDQAGGAGQSGGLSPQDAAELAQQLKDAQQLGQQLARDQAALERSQELAGALEGSRQRLGGDPQVAQGQSSGGDSPGQGGGPPQDGQGGQGTGQDGTSSAANGAAGGVGKDGHTWEDQGDFGVGDSLGGDKNDPSRSGGQRIDDFRKLYAAQRLAGAQSLMAGVDGQVDPNGKVDQLVVHLTDGDERATTPSVDVPASYRSQAAEAIEGEKVPPAYQEAVKDYFDQL